MIPVLEGLVENRRQERVEFGGGFGLQALEGVNFGLQIVKVSNYAMLF